MKTVQDVGLDNVEDNIFDFLFQDVVDNCLHTGDARDTTVHHQIAGNNDNIPVVTSDPVNNEDARDKTVHHHIAGNNDNIPVVTSRGVNNEGNLIDYTVAVPQQTTDVVQLNASNDEMCLLNNQEDRPELITEDHTNDCPGPIGNYEGRQINIIHSYEVHYEEEIRPGSPFPIHKICDKEKVDSLFIWTTHTADTINLTSSWIGIRNPSFVMLPGLQIREEFYGQAELQEDTIRVITQLFNELEISLNQGVSTTFTRWSKRLFLPPNWADICSEFNYQPPPPLIQNMFQLAPASHNPNDCQQFVAFVYHQASWATYIFDISTKFIHVVDPTILDFEDGRIYSRHSELACKLVYALHHSLTYTIGPPCWDYNLWTVKHVSHFSKNTRLKSSK